VKKCYLHPWNAWWFRDMVKSFGPWDFKNDPKYKHWPRVEEFGNYHYGYMGAALGLPLLVLENEAGRAQTQDPRTPPGYWPGHPSPHPWWPWGGEWPYGDDPRDQYWIERGYRDYYRDHGPKPELTRYPLI
jgi:hypothetical protein